MRRYDIDWLRVLVFGFLIFYHVGMFFVPWGFHIKNNTLYQSLVYPMLFVNQWRLPILFVISGMGTFYALNKRTGVQFSWERIKRLLLPLVIGMLFIVPPQVYIERLAKGQFTGSYFRYWPQYAFNGVYPEGNLSWHHLWFLPYLLIFSLLLIPLFLYLKKHPNASIIRFMRRLCNNTFSLFWLVVPLYLFEAFLEPFYNVTHALVDDWFNFMSSLFLFSYGFLVMCVQEHFWQRVQEKRRVYLYLGCISFSVFLFLIFGFEDSTVRHFTEALVKVINIWAWILAIFGYAATYLNKKSKVLAYANEAVYPFYILHQTVMICIAYYLMDLPWNLFSKASIMVLGTFLGSWLIYEIGIRRWKITRPLFGLKPKAK